MVVILVLQVGDEKEVAKLGMEDSPVLGRQLGMEDSPVLGSQLGMEDSY